MVQLPRETAPPDNARSAVPLTVSGKATGAGACTLTAGPVPLGYRWLINYVTVTVSAGASPAFNWYVDQAQLSNLIDGTADASSAVAPYNPARILDQGQQIVGVFAGAAANAQCTMRIEYDVQQV